MPRRARRAAELGLPPPPSRWLGASQALGERVHVAVPTAWAPVGPPAHEHGYRKSFTEPPARKRVAARRSGTPGRLPAAGTYHFDTASSACRRARRLPRRGSRRARRGSTERRPRRGQQEVRFSAKPGTTYRITMTDSSLTPAGGAVVESGRAGRQRPRGGQPLAGRRADRLLRWRSNAPGGRAASAAPGSAGGASILVPLASRGARGLRLPGPRERVDALLASARAGDSPR